MHSGEKGTWAIYPDYISRRKQPSKKKKKDPPSKKAQKDDQEKKLWAIIVCPSKEECDYS